MEQICGGMFTFLSNTKMSKTKGELRSSGAKFCTRFFRKQQAGIAGARDSRVRQMSFCLYAQPDPAGFEE